MTIRTKLRNISKETGIDPNNVNLAFALERMVARIVNNNELASSLVFKGGYVLFRSTGSRRITRDLDALGKDIDVERLKKLISIALSNDLEDEIRFLDIKIEDLKLHKLYRGVRTSCTFEIAPFKGATSRGLPKAQFDVSFGDFVPDDLDFHFLESYSGKHAPISWKVYPKEFIFSEKVHSVFTVEKNTRSKDVHDISILFDDCDPKKLKAAIERTFKRRKSPLPDSFSKRAELVQTENFRQNWHKVKSDEKGSFDKAWEKAIEVFKKIDDLKD